MNIILDRRLGTYPISIGTSLALETIARPVKQKDLREIPELRRPFSDYGVFAVNVNTVVRNLIASLNSKKVPSNTKPVREVIAEQAIQELDIMEDIIYNINKNVLFYRYTNSYFDFNLILKKFNIARTFSGATQARYELYRDTMTNLYNDNRIGNHHRGTMPLTKIRFGSRVLVFTSYPIDLLYNNRSTTLLEPHTGKTLDHDSYYKKLYPVPKEDMSTIPFNKVTLLLFGDKHMIKPSKIKLRKQCLELSRSKGWIYNTSISKIMDNILESDLKDLKELANFYYKS